MRVAFDIDGTLTRAEIRQLLYSLLGEANTVYILTGGIGDKPDYPSRVAQLEQLGVNRELYDGLHICMGEDLNEVSRKKGEFCRDKQVHLFVDDRIENASSVKSLSPETVILLVYGN